MPLLTTIHGYETPFSSKQPEGPISNIGSSSISKTLSEESLLIFSKLLPILEIPNESLPVIKSSILLISICLAKQDLLTFQSTIYLFLV